MTKTADVAAGAPIVNTWGNEIRDRTLQVFATNAERDAQWPTVPNGAECVTLDTGTIWVRRAGTWAPTTGTGQAPAPGPGPGSYTDPNGTVWVSKPGAYGGAWRKATDVVHVRLYRGAAWAVPTAYTAIPFDTAAEDPYALYNIGTSQFACPAAGIYLVTARMVALAAAGGQALDIALFKNYVIWQAGGGLAAPTNSYMKPALAAVARCAAGDHLAAAMATNPSMNSPGGASDCWCNIDYLGSG